MSNIDKCAVTEVTSDKLLSNLFANKATVVTLLLFLFWMVNDVMDRLIPENASAYQQQNVQDIVALKLPILSNTTASKISTAYQSFVLENDTEQTSSPMSAELQAQQQGELKTVFVGDTSLKLKAVVNINQNNSLNNHYALISVTNLKNNTMKLEKYFNGSDVVGFTITILNNTQVLLTKPRTVEHITENINEESKNTEQQKITLVMYQTANKSVDKSKNIDPAE